MKKMHLKQRLCAFLSDEHGSNAIEYALVGSIVTIIAIGAMIAMGVQLNTMMDNIRPYL